MYPRILAEISRHPWAITHDAMTGLLAAVRAASGLSSEDRPRFHAAAPDAAEAIVTELGKPRSGTLFSSARDGVGYLRIDGPIIPRADAMMESSGVVSIDTLSREFSALVADEEVNKIVLVVDSPGGIVTGVSEFAAQIAEAGKPTASYVYGMAASAAYWIASATDEIISADTGMVGSIGTVITVRRPGEDEEIIQSSQSPLKRPDMDSDEGRESVQSLVDGLAKTFIEAVARNRATTPEHVAASYGRGAVVLPGPALAAGMIDGVARLTEFIAESGASRSAASANQSATGLGTGLGTETFLDNLPASGDTGDTGEGRHRNGGHEMTLDQFLAENPGAAQELEQRITANRAEAEKVAAAEAVTAHRAKTAQAVKILASGYPAPIKAVAAQVLAGDLDPVALSATVATYDTTQAAAVIDDAAAAGNAVPATPAEPPRDHNDGLVRDEADIEAAVKAMREV